MEDPVQALVLVIPQVPGPAEVSGLELEPEPAQAVLAAQVINVAAAR